MEEEKEKGRRREENVPDVFRKLHPEESTTWKSVEGKFKSNRGLGSGVWRTIALHYVRIVNVPDAFRKLHPEESTTLKSVEGRFKSSRGLGSGGRQPYPTVNVPDACRKPHPGNLQP